jgi:hypothetical protein
VLTREIERLEGYRGIATNATFEGEKVVALDGLTKFWPRKKEESYSSSNSMQISSRV